jgi:RHS repeat-associated protein
MGCSVILVGCKSDLEKITPRDTVRLNGYFASVIKDNHYLLEQRHLRPDFRQTMVTNVNSILGKNRVTDVLFGARYQLTDPSLFLRLPGQWADSSWSGYGEELYYNVNRWYQPGTGRYSQMDPLALSGDPPYAYAFSRPLVYVDPLGLRFCVASLGGTRTGVIGIISHHLRSIFTRKPPPALL